MLNGMKHFFADDAQFISQGRGRIASQNSRMLSDAALLYAFVLLFYTVFAFVTEHTAFLRTMYVVFDLIHIAFCIAIFTHKNRLKRDYHTIQIFCCLFELSILGFFALEGAFTSAVQHSLYVPIPIILVLLLFTHGTAYSETLIITYTAAFAIMSYIHKQPGAFTNDLYIAIATFISTSIGYILTAKIRHREQRALFEYEKLSKTDILTGLLNKAGLDELCKENIDLSERSCALVVIDLDNFKRVNDEYGHGVGDEVLRRFGQAIQSVTRNADSAGRFGGDEFLMLLGSCQTSTDVQRRIAELRQITDELTVSVPSIQVSFCAGATQKQNNDTFHSMFSRADKALYKAKRGEKNAACVE